MSALFASEQEIDPSDMHILSWRIIAQEEQVVRYLTKEWSQNTIKTDSGKPVQEQFGKVTDHPNITSAIYTLLLKKPDTYCMSIF